MALDALLLHTSVLGGVTSVFIILLSTEVPEVAHSSS